MSKHVDDFQPLLKTAIAEARSAGLGVAAAELESRAFAAFTTSTELLGETRAAIRQFLKSGGSAVPAHVSSKLNQCLKEIGRGL